MPDPNKPKITPEQWEALRGGFKELFRSVQSAGEAAAEAEHEGEWDALSEFLRDIAECGSEVFALNGITPERVGEWAGMVGRERVAVQRAALDAKLNALRCGQMIHGRMLDKVAPFSLSDTGACGETIHGTSDLYRCADCQVAFHRECLRRHFEIDKRESERGNG